MSIYYILILFITRKISSELYKSIYKGSSVERVSFTYKGSKLPTNVEKTGISYYLNKKDCFKQAI